MEGNLAGPAASGAELRIDPGSIGGGAKQPAGIVVQGNRNTIGGPGKREGNTVSFNFDGIAVTGAVSDAIGNVVQGNDVRSNAGDGIDVNGTGATRTTIGGRKAGAGNVVGLNDVGINIAARKNVVQGNHVGLTEEGGRLARSGRDVPLSESLPQRVAGMWILEGASANLIGGGGGTSNVVAYTSPERGEQELNRRTGGIVALGGSGSDIRGNHIFKNGLTGGVVVLGGEGHAIRRNAIFENAAAGIDLGGDGAGDAPDTFDDDTGPNRLQNVPVIKSVGRKAGRTIVRGALESSKRARFAVDVYLASECGPASARPGEAAGQGRRYLGTDVDARSDGNGTAEFEVVFEERLKGMRALTATATDTAGNTSEFGPCGTG